MTTPAALPGTADKTAAADSAAGFLRGSSISGDSASFMKALDTARDSYPPAPRTEAERPAARPEPETRGPATEEDRQPARAEERPDAARDNREEARSREDDRPRDDKADARKEEPSSKENKDRSDAKSDERNEDGKAKQGDKEAAAETDADSDAKDKVKVSEEPILWDELARSLEEISGLVGVEQNQAAGKLKVEKDGADAKLKSGKNKTELAPDEAKTKLVAAEGPTVQNETKSNLKNVAREEARAEKNAEKNETARSENAGRQTATMSREGVIEKTGEQTIDPTKWSVHGRLDRAGEQNRDGDSKNSSSNKNTDRGMRFDPVKAADENAGRESGTQNGSSFGSDREFLGMQKDAAARLMQNSEARTAALRENRELFNSLVQKAQVNLGSEGKSSATIRLKPEFLGNMTLNLKVNGNQVEAVVLVDNRMAQKLLGDEIEHMRQELKLAGIQVESFSIRVKESSMAFLNDPNGEGQNTDAQAEDSKADSKRQPGQGAEEESGELESLEDGEIVNGDVEALEYESHLSGAANTSRVDLAV